MAVSDLCNHNVPCGQEGQPETTMESHEVLFLLLAPSIVLVVLLLVYISVVALLRRKKTNDRTLRAVSEHFPSRQDSTQVGPKRSRKKRGKNTSCTRNWEATDRPPSAELHSVSPTVVSALLRVHHVCVKCDTSAN